MNEQSPADVQASLLAALDTQDASARAYLNSFPLGAPSSAIATWIGGLGQVEWGYQRFQPVCTWLGQQGLPQGQQRLGAALNWLTQQRTTYVGMYNDKVQAENTQAAIWQNANQFGVNQAMAANNYQNAVTSNWVQGMLDVDENRCYGCHEPIGVPGGGYCYDCVGNRGLVY
jgi:hypothetical protein